MLYPSTSLEYQRDWVKRQNSSILIKNKNLSWFLNFKDEPLMS